MKYLFVIIVIFLFTPFVSSQNRHRGEGNPQRKIEQLEKVKLLEVLELDDDTAVRFFNLKNQHQRSMRNLRDQSDEILNSIEETLLKSDSKISLDRVLDDYLKNENAINTLRQNFLKEAESLLNKEQFAKYLVFERNFRAEIRDLMMGNRMNKRMRDQE
jgi:hypothetical protein